MNSPSASVLDSTDRRSVLGCLGMAGLGWLATSVPASAAPAQAPTVNIQTRPAAPAIRTTRSFDVPPEWSARQGAVLNDYWRYLTSLKFKNIKPGQVIQAHAKKKGEIWNSLPPKQWWVRMGYTLRVADRIASEMGVREVEIVSAYRAPAYNAHCEGAKVRSWHQANVAVDVKFPIAAAQVTAASRSLRDRGLFRGGIGGYGGFTHIDTRGVNTDW